VFDQIELAIGNFLHISAIGNGAIVAATVIVVFATNLWQRRR
jgi:hypothetical protein